VTRLSWKKALYRHPLKVEKINKNIVNFMKKNSFVWVKIRVLTKEFLIASSFVSKK